jgi:hypothetical protein
VGVAARKFAYELAFKPFKNIFNDDPTAVGLYMKTYMMLQGKTEGKVVPVLN